MHGDCRGFAGSRWLVWAMCGLIFALIGVGSLRAEQTDPALAERIAPLVRQLNADRAARRDAAEQALLALAPRDNAAACDAFLRQLPKPAEQMPDEVRLRLARIRRQIETRQARLAVTASKLSLNAQGMDLDQVLDQVYAQTGNRLTDYREQFGQDAQPRAVTAKIVDQDFWPAIDKLLDAAQMDLYPYSGKESLAVVQREASAAPRARRASYAGPFRVEAVNVVARRALRTPDQSGMQIELEIAWEPRLRPIALSQPAGAIEIIGDDGSKIPLANPQAVLDVEIQPGSHATELTIPLGLPPRSVLKLSQFKGQLSALVPGRIVEFRFSHLDQGQRVEQQRGGVTVIVDSVRKNQALWEVHMRLQVHGDEAALESHRGWVFQNLCYLLNSNGEVVDHAGYETTLQAEHEIGLAYFFELPDDIAGYTWVYRTPAAIVRVPVSYELTDIALP